MKCYMKIADKISLAENLLKMGVIKTADQYFNLLNLNRTIIFRNGQLIYYTFNTEFIILKYEN